MSGTHGSPFGRRRMCCAQTAAPEEKKRKRWEIQKHSECTVTSIISKCNEKRWKIQPWDLRKPSRTLTEPFKIDPGQPFGSIWQPGGTQERPRVPPYIGCPQEQLSIPGVPSLIFRSFFLSYFYSLQTLPNLSKTLPKTYPKLIFFAIFSYCFFALILHGFSVDFLLIFNVSKP